MTESPVLNKSPLHERHVALGAKFAEFGGWEMPIEYGGGVAEHTAVRTRSGCSTSATWARQRGGRRGGVRERDR